MSLKSGDKAWHTPYFTFRVVKSALEFLGFPYIEAFSHKELMVLILTYGLIYGQKGEMSTDVHPLYMRGGHH